MWGCGGNSAVQSHRMGGVMGESGGTHRNTQERTRECCTYPLATYPLKSTRKSFWCGRSIINRMVQMLGPDLPFLAFLDFLAFFAARNFLVFLSVFPFSQGFLGFSMEKILAFLGGFPCFFQTSKERKIRGNH